MHCRAIFLRESLQMCIFFCNFAAQSCKDMPPRTNDISLFLAFCIEQYKQRHHMSGERAMQELDQYGVLEYLEECYAPLHTQSAQWIMEDIDEFIEKRKQ